MRELCKNRNMNFPYVAKMKNEVIFLPIIYGLYKTKFASPPTSATMFDVLFYTIYNLHSRLMWISWFKNRVTTTIQRKMLIPTKLACEKKNPNKIDQRQCQTIWNNQAERVSEDDLPLWESKQICVMHTTMTATVVNLIYICLESNFFGESYICS